uniref:Rab-like protein 5 n=1 Tax=Macrostomum lignano TaxID=282301 RepID=A0A1I8F4Z1_9PLAT
EIYKKYSRLWQHEQTKASVVGPVACGKTYLTNFLSEAIEQSSGEYRPTQACRIVEYETRQGSQYIEVQLWDISGDKKFASCWPALVSSVNGVVFVYNQDQPQQSEELDQLYSSSSFKITESRTPNMDSLQLSDKFENVRTVASDIPSAGDQLRDDFNNFLLHCLPEHE